MNDKYTEMLSGKTCAQFVTALASGEPVPGGGGAAALTGAVGSALCSMVANFTTGKKKYAQYENDIQKILEQSAEIQVELLDLINRDAENFKPLQKAYSIPKDDPNRETEIQKAAIKACEAPLKMMRCICKATDLIEEIRIKGSVMLVSDAGCGALCCRAALESAAMNVFVNTKSLPYEIAGDIENEAAVMMDEYCVKAEKTAEAVMAKLRSR